MGAEADSSIDGATVRLRPVTVHDAELLALWQSTEYVGEFNVFGVTGQPVKKPIPAGGLDRFAGGSLVVELRANRKPIGSVSWRGVAYGPNPESVAWNIGINLIPEARGRGFGTEAQQLLAVHLFATTAVNRIEASTDVENVPEQRALEKAGFLKEGVLRGAQYRPGGWHDLMVYACVRQRDLRPDQ